MKEKLDYLIGEIDSKFSGNIGVAILAPGKDISYSYKGDISYATASTMKIFVLGALLKKVELGELNLTDRVELKKNEQVGGSGVLKELDPGLNLTIKDIATLMIIKSDNTATNMCIDLIGGVTALNTHMKKVGLIESKVGCKVDFEEIGDDFRKLGVSTADELVLYLSKILSGELLSEDGKNTFISILRKQQYLEQFPRYLPFNPYAEDLGIPIGEGDLVVANKTGFTTGTRVDVGFIFKGNQPYIYAAMTNDCKDESFAPDNEGNLAVAQIGRTLFEQIIL